MSVDKIEWNDGIAGYLMGYLVILVFILILIFVFGAGMFVGMLI